MTLAELNELTKKLVLETGKGSEDVCFLDTESGEVYELRDVTRDDAAESFFILGALSEEG